MFYIKGRQESMNDALYVFLNGWTCLKFNNIPHDMTNDEFLATAASKAYSDIDFPMIRLGEIYLIYAEACMNLGQANTALPKLQEPEQPCRGIGPPRRSRPTTYSRSVPAKPDVEGQLPHRPDPLRQVHHPVVPLDIQGRHLHRTGVR